MAVTVRQLFKNAEQLYRAKLIAGEEGLENLVEWVHIVEDSEVGLFLHGGELVFTTGIADGSDEWLMDFAKNLHESQASAFVINLDVYIPRVPDELMDYCNKIKMPLFTIPWETRQVDMTRDFCQKIIENENTETSVASGLKNILFDVEDIGTQVTIMERHGYLENFYYNFICVSTDTEYGTEEYFMEEKQIKKILERLAKSLHEQYIFFRFREKLFFVLAEYAEVEKTYFYDEFFKLLSHCKLLAKVHIGVSPNIQGIKKQRANFDCSYATNELAIKKGEKILFYDELGIDKIIMAVENKNILKKYFDDTIGKLQLYDKENNSNLYDFLKEYLELDASPRAVSEKLFIHRNTVNNYLKKIDAVLGVESMDLEQKAKLLIAYHIADMLH